MLLALMGGKALKILKKIASIWDWLETSKTGAVIGWIYVSLLAIALVIGLVNMIYGR